MQMMLHFLFLGALSGCIGLFLLRRPRGASWMGYGFGVLFLTLLIHQGWWQLHGASDAAFLHFRDHFDQRAKTPRGQFLDRHGQPTGPTIPATYHLFGYNKKGAITGLEKVYNTRLAGNVLPSHTSDLLRRTPPQDITLSIDISLQTAAYAALNGQRGAIIALDPQTGEILALVSSPSLTLENLATGKFSKTYSPEFNRATQGLYPPGSVFKIFSAALAIEEGLAHPRTCPAQGWRPAKNTPPIRDTHINNDTALSISTAFSESSNIWFAKAMIDCGWETFYAAFQRAHLNQGLTIAREGNYSIGTARGRLPSLAGKNAALAYPGFGQGDLLLTPMHIAMLTATIANNGIMHFPHLEKETPLMPPVRVWKSQTAKNVKELMAASVRHGTSHNVNINGLSICGKTGTAERTGQTSHAWFTCFAPKENPKIVITVLVENGGYGADSALPIAKALLQQTFQKNKKH